MEKTNKNSTTDKYSFFKLKRSDVLDSSDTSENIDVGDDSVQKEDNKKFESVEIFSINDATVFQEYSFDSGYTAIYRSISEDELALIYESEYSDTLNEFTTFIYTPDGVFTAHYDSNQNFHSVSYIDKVYFLKLDKIGNIPILSLPFIKDIKHVAENLFIGNHWIPIINKDGELIKDDMRLKLFKRFRNLYPRYNLASNCIPACLIIDSILKQANHYVATHELDKEKLLDDYIKLQNFSQMCSGTIQDISSFVENPTTTDFRLLCDQLSKSHKNLSNFIDIYLAKELQEDLEK